MEKKIGEVENKIPDVSDLVATAAFNTKVCEAETKTPGIIGLATTSVLNKKIEEVENKIHVTGVVKKTVCDATISDIEGKYFTTFDYRREGDVP